jgi:1-acyl-sn-glycerol-3-phosphate acyltransferase
MISFLRSLWVWSAIAVLIIVWLPLLALVRLMDRDPAHYTTGRWFRRLGSAMTRVNPLWKITVRGVTAEIRRKPIVVVSNHQSLADIPVLSRLPWEMKWVAKQELFQIPIVGWMMRLAGDIPLERGDARSGARVLANAARYLRNNCPVFIFPEGTRSPNGLVGRFSEGPFLLAISSGVPILPIVVEGTRDALPKKNWRFGQVSTIAVSLLPEVSTDGLSRDDAAGLRDRIRMMICEDLAGQRNVSLSSVDSMLERRSNEA